MMTHKSQEASQQESNSFSREDVKDDTSMRGHDVKYRTHQDAIKLGCHKGEARLIGGLGKGLVLDGQAAESQGVLAEES